MRDVQKTIGNLIDHQKTAIIASVDADGMPNLKAMFAPRLREGIHALYFSTNTSSERVAQYRQNDKAAVYFYDRRFFRGVQLLGRMEVQTDPAIKSRCWQTGDTMYYPLGVTDPDYCILCFYAQRGRYYSKLRSETFEVLRDME